MTLQILNKNETREILNLLKKQFQILEIPGQIIKIGKERLFLYQGSLNKEEIKKLDATILIERAGVYFGKVKDNEIRLSIEGTHLFKDQIKKNIFEMNEKQTDEWMHGSELNVSSGKFGFAIMKHRDDFLGTGKASAEKITNFIPKNRRLKFKN